MNRNDLINPHRFYGKYEEEVDREVRSSRCCKKESEGDNGIAECATAAKGQSVAVDDGILVELKDILFGNTEPARRKRDGVSADHGESVRQSDRAQTFWGSLLGGRRR